MWVLTTSAVLRQRVRRWERSAGRPPGSPRPAAAAVHDHPASVLVVRDRRPGRAAGRTAPARPAAARSASGTSPSTPNACPRGTARTSPASTRADVAGACGSGTSSAAQPCAANSRRRPCRTASASSGSVVVGEVLPRRRRAPLLAHEQHRRERRGQHQRRRRPEQAGRRALADSRSPTRPVADLVVVLQRTPRNRARAPAPVDRPPVRAAAERRAASPSWKNAPVSVLGQRVDGDAEVGVVALPLAGQQRVQRVVEVVAPLRASARARRPRAASTSAGRSGRTRRSGSAAGRGARRARRPRADSSSSRCTARVVGQRVHGVEPQPVEVVVAQPHQRVVDDAAPHLVGARRRRG